MSGIHDHSKMVAVIWQGPQAAHVDGVPAYADIGAALFDAANHFPDLTLFQTDTHIEVSLRERADVDRQKLRNGRLASKNAHLALHALRKGAHFGLHAIKQLQRFTRIASECLAGGRHRDATPPPLEKFDARLGLHLGDTLADR